MASWHTKNVIRTLSGYLVVDGDGEIRVYGDPEGLRSLGQALISVADLDQSALDDRECPPDDSFHQHYTIMQADGSLGGLTVGRVDEKASGRIRDCFPAV
ncbi:Imm32 family immunity protein [Lacipirellula parvula]|nr:hypothetical protein [Lacipirellula parvula]